MVAELPTIPERHLLAALLELDADLPAVAARTRTPLDELTRWAHTDAVRAWLDAHNHFSRIAREHRELTRVTRTLDDLEALARATQDPIEKRRLLTAILRGSLAILHSTRPRPQPRANRDTPPTPHSQAPDRSAASGPTALSAPAEPSGPADLAPLAGLADQPTEAAAPTLAAPPAPPCGSSPGRLVREHVDRPATRHQASAAPQSFVTPLIPAFPLYNQDLPLGPTRRNTRTPAHLLAAAGLPAP